MTSREIIKILKKDGYVLVMSKGKGSHMRFKKPHCVTVTVPNHGSKDVSIGVLKSLERTTGLSFRR